jgi:hypothetical protein
MMETGDDQISGIGDFYWLESEALTEEWMRRKSWIALTKVQ